ncbi:MAG: hypothetical protein F6K39_46790 [Okeania sp. SIO3B3]|nr:hypothetical protein [Okeania sp. SIO3B3]
MSIATASGDKTARLWDRETGRELATLNHDDLVRAVAFSPDGKTIATASDDKTARLWDANTGKELATLNHDDLVGAVAFSPDGKTIATGSNDKTARLHRVMPKALMTEACRRLSRNLTAEEWQKYMSSGLDKYQRTCEELPVHRSLIAEAKKLAKTGEKQKINEAISILKHAQELEPEIDLDPDTKAKETDPEVVAQKFVASGKVEEGKKLAEQGKIEEAISLYDKAQKLDPDVKIYADDWTALCEYGSLNNQAEDVIFACENAVELSPDNGFIQGSRGLARALTGDYQGAIEDFQVLVNSLEDGEEKAKIEGWIETLKKGENPITSEELDKLKY